MGYADNINVLARSRMALNEVHTALENEAINLGLNINTQKTKAIVQKRKQMKKKSNPFK
jgi:Reverse transcriptase (RNA-dependent DNA polymerase).